MYAYGFRSAAFLLQMPGSLPFSSKYITEVYLKALLKGLRSFSFTSFLAEFIQNTNTDFCIYCWVTHEGIATHEQLKVTWSRRWIFRNMTRTNEKTLKKRFHWQSYMGKQSALGNSAISMLETLKQLQCCCHVKHLIVDPPATRAEDTYLKLVRFCVILFLSIPGKKKSVVK